MKKKINLFILTMIAVFGLATSCSEYDAGAPLLVRDLYNNAFKEAFDIETISPEQTWGFYIPGNETRGTLPGVVDNPQNYEDIYQPAGFTTNQLEIIRLFFQNNRYLDGISYPYTEFFAQQVYKGNTKVGTQYGSASDCTESYKSLDGNTHTSDQMNYFDVKGQDGSDFHIDSFNKGSYDRGKESGMYAVDADASEFSYINSSNSRVTGSYVIIDGETIDAWASGAGASILQSQGISFESVATCTSKSPNGDTKTIKRYYLGFDFRLLEGEETYTGQYLEIGGKQYPYVTDNKNMYAGEKEFINNLNMVLGIINYPQNYNDQQKEQYASDVEKLKKLLDEGYLPIGQNGDFVKLGTVRNGYYSDWVISITPGTVGTPEKPKDDDYGKYGPCRIICEDLVTGIYADGDITHISSSDWDYNDLIFDAEIKNNTVYITVQSLGGTLPIYIEGIKEELHVACGGTTGVMNYVDNPPHDDEGNYYGLQKKLEIENASSYGITYIHDIRVYVTRNGNNIDLPADKGQAPAKICVKKNFKWCDERESIKKKYENITKWMEHPNDWNGDQWYNTIFDK